MKVAVSIYFFFVGLQYTIDIHAVKGLAESQIDFTIHCLLEPLLPER